MSKSHTLLISEKPQASQRIAEALADEKPKRVERRGAYWFEFSRDGKKHVCIPAVGHLFVLNTKKRNKWNYPVFDVEWVPTFSRRGYSWTKKYYENIKDLVKNADDFIVACDYDTEGEVIGFNVLKFMCGKEDAKRMVFSTLTRGDLIEAYENVKPHLDFGQVEAGLTRHFLDFYYGINTTRALTASMKKHFKGFQIISSGRVQSPTLFMLNEREEEIKKFIPVPFWQIQLHCKYDSKEFIADYEEDQIWESKRAQKIVDSCEGKDASVVEVRKRKYRQKPPIPFNTTSFQTEVYGQFRYSPRQAMRIAEGLYQAGLISYPRTGSEKLPEKIDYKRILNNLSKIRGYLKPCKKILRKKELKPIEGRRSDPAHPAIYPTGEKPKKLTPQQKRVYDLIVRRFMSCFGDPALRESVKVVLGVNDHNFLLKGRRTIEKGWMEFYGPYMRFEEQILPDLKEGDVLKVSKIDLLDKETQPPNRFTQGSIIKEMSKKGLGTKSTRANILQTLYDRGYIVGKSIQVTFLGKNVVEVLGDYSPRLLSEELTKRFEEEMEKVEKKGKSREKVVKEARKVLTDTLKDFKQNEDEIGKKLLDAFIKYKRNQKRLGVCPECGKDLKIVRSRRTGKRFCGCSGYSKGCRFSTPLPQRGIISPTGKTCKECDHPVITVKITGKRPFTSCINMDCPTKEKYVKKKKK